LTYGVSQAYPRVIWIELLTFNPYHHFEVQFPPGFLFFIPAFCALSAAVWLKALRVDLLIAMRPMALKENRLAGRSGEVEKV
jgi:hypothetical protein